ncbi:MAG TPA: DUF4366 domain-containing protein [Lachnospiraceae bacterium]|nr:DUF4366 domain-containing protein [Lachnospiraceae bacterium]
MNKLESMLDMIKSNEFKMNELLHKKQDKKKNNHVVLWILAAVGVLVAVGTAAYFIYRHVKPDYLDDFEDDFEDDYEEDEFEEDGQE